MSRFLKYIVLLIFTVVTLSPTKVESSMPTVKVAARDSLLVGFSGLQYTLLCHGLRALERNMMFTLGRGAEPISIVHIGDSHIQAGWLTGRMRSRFQADFGDAGRGLIMPLKLASTNEPNDYRLKSTSKWHSSKVNSKRDRERAGVGGISIFDGRGDISIKMLTDGSSPLSTFDEVIVYHSPSSGEVKCSSPYDTGISCQDTLLGVTTNFALTEMTDTISFYSDKSVEYYGFDLRRSQLGVVYHSIGVNGACYTHYGQRPELLKQMSLLGAGLIVVSMGTNEASGSRFNSEQFLSQVDKMISGLKRENPSCPILITTPPPFYRKGVENRNISKVASLLKDYAKRNGIALFDAYQACKESGRYESDSPLISRDGIHLTKQGYADIADMLYDNLMDSYYFTMRTLEQ